MTNHPRIAVVSPFLDKSHGTERCICEQIEHLARDYGYEIHIYSRQVEDVEGAQIYKPGRSGGAGTIWWHRTPDMLPPYVIRYSWWFMINQLYRWWDTRVAGLSYDAVYTPGINCLDADIISVHIIFAEFHRLVRRELQLQRNPIRVWHRLIHSWVYHQMIMALEGLVYTKNTTVFAPISRKTANDQARFYRERPFTHVIYYGFYTGQFTADRRAYLRAPARNELKIPTGVFAVLLVGNAWKKKGLHILLTAVGKLDKPDIWVLVAGQDDRAPYERMIQQYNLGKRVHFLPIRKDVETYYAAADIYAGPSLEDAFALPPAEAMACGVATIASSQAGVSEVITHGEDGFILKDPTDTDELAGYIRQLYEDPVLRQRMGDTAAQTTKRYTWARNAAKLHVLLQETILRKRNGKRR